jgi:hypothetical protein
MKQQAGRPQDLEDIKSLNLLNENGTNENYSIT